MTCPRETMFLSYPATKLQPDFYLQRRNTPINTEDYEYPDHI